MAKIRKYANGIERFLHGEKGQRFFNIVFSLGAAVVIWGALFKILHLPGGGVLLCIGMGTEIAMFILTAFDRPPKEYAWEDVFPELDSKNGETANGTPKKAAGRQTVVASGYPETAMAAPLAASAAIPVEDSADKVSSRQLQERIDDLSERISRLQEMTEDNMESLNGSLAGLNEVYDRHKKSVEDQLESIDSVNRGLRDIREMYERSAGDSDRFCDETDRLVRNMRQLNAVYEKMISAMTVNMYGGYGRRRDYDPGYDEPQGAPYGRRRERDRIDRPENRED